jgi:hypothetical protein
MSLSPSETITTLSLINIHVYLSFHIDSFHHKSLCMKCYFYALDEFYQEYEVIMILHVSMGKGASYINLSAYFSFQFFFFFHVSRNYSNCISHFHHVLTDGCVLWNMIFWAYTCTDFTLSPNSNVFFKN